jgi:regulation of enolase protein 1 (concanavalin A-like superfamily)
MPADQSFTLSSIPAPMTWKNQPSESTSDAEQQISITTGADTDWFINPAGAHVKSNAPIALCTPPDHVCCLQARVTVEFAATYDAGTLFVYAHDALWAKLCFEYSPQQQPMIVSVVTRGVSDDCNSVGVEDNSVYLRVYRHRKVLAFHYSLDGHDWHFVRYFSLGDSGQPRIGFSTQSPTGRGCKASFSEIRYAPGTLSDLRNGE